ncbi:hypothetical protein IW261DRAFT_1505955 [Armillaria novae-zelandiae]|uniref:Uncharacterized protein n=1 Tax=Armillaria novae-zelandiae TaxID=153914 RepID=A0AA39U880_9AGAR|nr:hypothetical protein IW261DRAFT_1505955 [Armillaria novae-zelandiae]
MSFLWLTAPIMTAIVSCVRQVFYAYRIFILSKSRIIPISIICPDSSTIYRYCCSSVAAMITGIYAFQAGTIIKLGEQKASIAIGIWCGASALCDILIAICMTYYASSSDISQYWFPSNPGTAHKDNSPHH